MKLNTEDLKDIGSIQNDYGCDLYLYVGDIEPVGFMSISHEIGRTLDIRKEKKGLSAILILITFGGDPNSAYRISRLFQQKYGKFIIFPPWFSKSAGTLVALGANELIMNEYSELGPLDVQVLRVDERDSKSGLLMKSTFEFMFKEVISQFDNLIKKIMGTYRNISFNVASQIASTLTADLMKPIFSQLNPQEIGSDYRLSKIAEEYGRRLAEKSGNIKQGTIEELINRYPSHEFVIDKPEAKKYFNNIEDPNDQLNQFALRKMEQTARYLFNKRPPLVLSLTKAAEECQNSDGKNNSKPNQSTK